MSESKPTLRSRVATTLGEGFRAVVAYETAKVVEVRSLKLGFFNRFVQLAILGYVIGYTIVYQKGYQTQAPLQSTLTTKVKNVGFACQSTDSAGGRYGGRGGAAIGVTTCPIPGVDPPGNTELSLWDSTDYVIPANEHDALFILTNSIVTPEQKQTTCAEDPQYAQACTDDSECTKYSSTRNGIMTGRCVNSTCEIYAWAPLELDSLSPQSGSVIEQAGNFTVFIKNNVRFAKFGISRTNVDIGNTSAAYLANCRWNKETDYYCPIFKLGDLVEASGWKIEDMLVLGGVLGVNLDWTCNFDNDESECRPVFSISRIDDPTSTSPGYNFRYADYYTLPSPTDPSISVPHRDLIKAYGIRLIFVVSGEGGKFDVAALTMSLGSGLALLGLATLLCDFFMTHFFAKKDYYREKKFELVDDLPPLDQTFSRLVGGPRRSEVAVPVPSTSTSVGSVQGGNTASEKSPLLQEDQRHTWS
ncbi:purinergic receptor P2X [Capsaspora owczarzaki ATCC 30864]|uniref:purinergic receptor P2X n=1 Tax=Capsaspora owczarzaki (strain ATCC 30864) TaxID=595528 RepID=UPI0001FE4E7B|nr:purinergic receptor P2X [Capsaspora owczarzaki ATCC 30864]|eukprot:XP_004365148.1 purinergic receptor P2X [Capsaspora owczarzaki ATCC 30864]